MSKQNSQMPKLKQISKLDFDPEIFETHKTGTDIDQMFSVKGGIPKATNWMIVGDPGVGKSTVTLDVLANLHEQGVRVLFISAEMNEVDLYMYVERYPKFGKLNIFFPQECEDQGINAKEALVELLNQGWDVVLTDSFVELQDIIREVGHMTGRSAEKFLLQQMYNHNLGQNDRNCYTSFLNIQQVNKGGVFVGSNKLKHMTTGMMEIRFVNEETQEERYIVFSKNRRGDVGKQMFFDLSGEGDVQYDTDRFEKAEKFRELRKTEKEKIKDEGLKVDELLGLVDPDNTPLDSSSENTEE